MTSSQERTLRILLWSAVIAVAIMAGIEVWLINRRVPEVPAVAPAVKVETVPSYPCPDGKCA